MTTSVGPRSGRSSASGPLCSTWTREHGVDPIGSAGCYRGYLLVEWPLPWPRDMSEDPELAPLVEAARLAGMRFQGLVPASVDGASRVVCYRWPPNGPAFERAELAVDKGEVIAAGLAVLDEPPSKDGIVEVLVCTHGRRDRCCGSLGTALASEITADPLGDEGVKVWRTSHTGGHRFAPTAVVLPQGTAWAFCDRDILSRIVRHDGSVGEVLARYRGCAGMGSPVIQALERAVLGEVGWPLFDMARHGEDLGDARVELVVGEPGGARSVWEAFVRAETAPMPDCGMPVELATKTERQFVVEGLRRR
jgi:hypothetical protein